MAKKSAQLIDGKALSTIILLDLKAKIDNLERLPGLAVILVGDDAPSHLYVKNKKRAAEKINVMFCEYQSGQSGSPMINEAELLGVIDWLNNDDGIDGIIVQLPLPPGFNTDKIIERIDPTKDVDGFHPANREKKLDQSSGYQSPLIQAIMVALQATEEKLSGKKAVVVTKSKLFGEPLAEFLKGLKLEVELVAPDDISLAEKTLPADVLISVAGQKNLIKKTMVKPDAIVIDAGTNLVDEKTWVGDVDPEVKDVAAWLTPVPGGIGPLTVALLLKNVYQLAAAKEPKKPALLDSSDWLEA